MKRFGVPQTSSGGNCKKACKWVTVAPRCILGNVYLRSNLPIKWVTVAEEHLKKAPECLLSIAAQEPPEEGDIVLTAWPDPDPLALQVLPTKHDPTVRDQQRCFCTPGALCQ